MKEAENRILFFVAVNVVSVRGPGFLVLGLLVVSAAQAPGKSCPGAPVPQCAGAPGRLQHVVSRVTSDPQVPRASPTPSGPLHAPDPHGPGGPRVLQERVGRWVVQEEREREREREGERRAGVQTPHAGFLIHMRPPRRDLIG